MKIQHGFLLVASLTLSFITVQAESSEVTEFAGPAKSARDRLAENAQEVGLSLRELVEAGKRYGLLSESSGLLDNALPLYDTTEFKKAFYYVKYGRPLPEKVKKDLVKLINDRKANLATHLGIDVSKVDKFIAGFDDKPKSSNTELGQLDNIERIRVVCSDDYCNSGSFGNGSLALSLWFTGTAIEKDIGNYEVFTVDYTVDDSLVKKERWRMNVFSGAYFLEVSPCHQCEKSL